MKRFFLAMFFSAVGFCQGAEEPRKSGLWNDQNQNTQRESVIHYVDGELRSQPWDDRNREMELKIQGALSAQDGPLLKALFDRLTPYSWVGYLDYNTLGTYFLVDLRCISIFFIRASRPGISKVDLRDVQRFLSQYNQKFYVEQRGRGGAQTIIRPFNSQMLDYLFLPT